MGKCLIFLFLIAGCCLPFFALRAQELDFRLLDARSKALGGGIITLDHLPAGALFNPAGLVNVRRPTGVIHFPREFRYNQVALANLFPGFGSLGVAFARHGWGGQTITLGAAGFGLLVGSGMSLGVAVQTFQIGSREQWRLAGSFQVDVPQALPELRRLGYALLMGCGFRSVLVARDSSTAGLASRFYLGFRFSPPVRSIRWHSELQIEEKRAVWLNGLEWDLTPYWTLRLGTRDWKPSHLSGGVGIKIANADIDLVYDRYQKRVQATVTVFSGLPPQVRARQYYQETLELLKTKRLREALEKITFAIRFDPENRLYQEIRQRIWVHYQQLKAEEQRLFAEARQLEFQGKYLAAYLKYQDLLRKYPEHSVAKQKLAYLHSSALFELKQIRPRLELLYREEKFLALKRVFDLLGDFVQADSSVQVLRQRTERKLSELAERHYYTGLGYFSQKRFREAEKELQLALEFNPDLPNADLYLREVQAQLRRQQARIDSLFNLAMDSRARQEYDAAIRYYQAVLEIDPGNALAQSALDTLRPMVEAYVQELYRKARTEFKRENYTWAENLCQQILRIRNDFEQARRFLKEIRSTKRTLARRLAAQAEEAVQKGRTEVALRLLRKASRLDPKNARYKGRLRQLEQIAARQEQWRKAQKAFENNDFNLAEKIVVDLLAADPNRREYAQFLSKVRTSKNRYITFLLQNGIQLYSREEYKEAIRTFDRLLKLDPDNKTAKEYRRRTQEKIRALERLK
jgi:tetratricopeptide (TPR) repeat protein